MASQEKNPELIAFARDLAEVPMCDDYEKMISGMLYVSILTLSTSYINTYTILIPQTRAPDCPMLIGPGITPSCPASWKPATAAAS